MKKLLMLLIVLLTSCSVMPLKPVPSFSPTIVATPILATSASTAKHPSPTLTPSPICPDSGNPSVAVAPSVMNISWIKKTINDYLNQGGDPGKLAEILSMPEYGRLEVRADSVDINSDDVDELVYSTGPFRTTFTGSDGVDSGFWVFQCEYGAYRIVYAKEMKGGYGHSPRLVAAEDLNNDKRQEIVIRATWNGSGCLQFFYIISWENGKSYPTRRMDDQDFPCGTEFAFGEVDNNGNREILFEGKSNIRYDSVAMIQRDFVDTYELNNQVYILKSHVYLPSPYRVYAIYDAQQALNNSNLPQAIRLYDQAAHDETLLDIDSLIFTPGLYARDWPASLSKKDHPKEYVSAFALFRLAVLNLEINEEQKASSALNELDTLYPAGSAGSEFTEAAHLFMEYSKFDEGPILACQAVSSLIEHNYPFLDWHFEWSTWTSFHYTNRTLCPYSSDR